MKNKQECYKDGSRVCDEGCVAYTLNLIYGSDSQDNALTGHCMELAAKFRLTVEIGEIRKILEKKKK